MKTTTDTKLLATAAMILSLAACSSADNGYDDGLTEMQRQDQAASANATGLFNFASTQIGLGTDETSEPRDISGIVPPADDTSEPFPLI